MADASDITRTPNAHPHPDHSLLEAVRRREEILATIKSYPNIDTDHPFWRALDEAEHTLRDTPAATLDGVLARMSLLQLEFTQGISNFGLSLCRFGAADIRHISATAGRPEARQ